MEHALTICLFSGSIFSVIVVQVGNKVLNDLVEQKRETSDCVN